MAGYSLGMRLAVAVVFLLFLGLMTPLPAEAAGCKTACGYEQPPNCLGCTFMALSHIMCLRLQCNFCQEEYCWVGVPAADDQLAQSEPAPAAALPTRSKILLVKVLSPRT